VRVPLARLSTVALPSVYRKNLISNLSASALTRRRKRFAVTSARLFGGSIGMMYWSS
jgi:hypothetical protein